MLRRDDLMIWTMATFFLTCALTVVTHSNVFAIPCFVSGVAITVMLIWDNLK